MLRILLVDDDDLVGNALGRMLRRRFDVLIERNAVSALAAVQRERIAAVVSDYNMPGADGLWLLQQVRNVSPDTRRVLMSGDPDRVPLQAAEPGLVERLLAKPIPVRALESCLAELLSRFPSGIDED